MYCLPEKTGSGQELRLALAAVTIAVGTAARVVAAFVLAVGVSAYAQPPKSASDGSILDRLLLRDYRPESIYKVPQTTIRKARFPVIDIHSHAYAKDAEEVERWVRVMDEVGIEKTIVMVRAQEFETVKARFAAHSQRFEIWCDIDFSGLGEADFVERAIARLVKCHCQGARGVGELVDKGRGFLGGMSGPPVAPGLHLDDPRMDPILEKCADLRLPVSVHVGEDRWEYEPMDHRNDGLPRAARWAIPDELGVLRHAEMIATLDRAVAKHPRVTFIACHFANCCTDLSVLGAMLDKYPNLYADTGARFGQTAAIPRYMKKFFERYQDRLLYGTDAGMDAQMYRTSFRILESEDEHFYCDRYRQFHYPLHGFGLSDEVLKKVYSSNARRILHQRDTP